MRTGSLFCATLFIAGGSHAADALLEADIRREIIGRTIYLAAPLGGEFPLTYRPSGVVDGDGTAVGLGKFIKPDDNGRWWIEADRLCQQFTVWYKGAAMCFELTKVGVDRVKWLRDYGESGIARIGECCSRLSPPRAAGRRTGPRGRPA